MSRVRCQFCNKLVLYKYVSEHKAIVHGVIRAKRGRPPAAKKKVVKDPPVELLAKAPAQTDLELVVDDPLVELLAKGPAQTELELVVDDPPVESLAKAPAQTELELVGPRRPRRAPKPIVRPHTHAPKLPKKVLPDDMDCDFETIISQGCQAQRAAPTRNSFAERRPSVDSVTNTRFEVRSS